MPDYLLVLFGLTLLIAAGEFTLRGTVGLARQLKISPAIIGLTVVGFGTSLPELMVSVQAAWDGRPGFAVGRGTRLRVSIGDCSEPLDFPSKPPESWRSGQGYWGSSFVGDVDAMFPSRKGGKARATR